MRLNEEILVDFTKKGHFGFQKSYTTVGPVKEIKRLAKEVNSGVYRYNGQKFF